ncbi:hypothetical protein BN1263160042 [Stenotrophomonas maltophilia]|nr:hypothetical protein BN1263160042 [Stenotrophomonas maltophilia]
MTLPTEPRFAHSYDPHTRAYMGKVRLQPSPDGAWNLPDFTVDVDPPPGRRRIPVTAPGRGWLTLGIGGRFPQLHAVGHAHRDGGTQSPRAG